MKIALSTRLQLWVAKLLTKLLGRFLDPVKVFALTGIMPYIEATSTPSILCEYPDTPLFDAPTPPTTLDDTEWSVSITSRITPTRLVCVTDGIALSTGAVFNGQGRFIEQASHDFEIIDKSAHKRHRIVSRPHCLLPGIREFGHDVVSLVASNQRFYFHWIFDVLPRLGMARQAGFENGPFFVSTKLPFQRETLKILGIDESRLINASEIGAIVTPNLVVPCHRIMPGLEYSKWSIDFLRGNFLVAQDEGPGSSPRRLYVSRGSATHRRVTNEPELVFCLSRYGFEAIRTEELPFREQVSLFGNAEIVVAPHGGGLANLVFCTPGTKVIELFPAANIDLFYRLATRMQLDYRFVKSKDNHGRFMGPQDYRIDPNELTVVLDAFDAWGK